MSVRKGLSYVFKTVETENEEEASSPNPNPNFTLRCDFCADALSISSYLHKDERKLSICVKFVTNTNEYYGIVWDEEEKSAIVIVRKQHSIYDVWKEIKKKLTK